MTHHCPACNKDIGAVQFAGKCPHCGQAFRATSASKLWLYGAVFCGMLFGPMIVTPVMAGQGVNPQSVPGMLMGLMGSITAVLFLGALSLRMLKLERAST